MVYLALNKGNKIMREIEAVIETIQDVKEAIKTVDNHEDKNFFIDSTESICPDTIEKKTTWKLYQLI